MAKAIKAAPVVEQDQTVSEQTGITDPIITADIPAQLPEETPMAQVVYPLEQTESDEILFLRRILHIQHTGGFGRHLDDIIYERIKELKK